jgi:hypothetical protein
MSEKYAVVRTVATFYHTYAIPMSQLQEMNTDAEVDPKWLQDMIVMQEMEELGQEFLGEQITNNLEVVEEDQMIKIFDNVNDYLKGWTREQKIAHIHKLKDVR